MPLNIFEPRVKFPTFLICPAAQSGPETLQQLVSAAVTLVTRAVNVSSRSFKVLGDDTILNQGGYDGRGQRSCKCNKFALLWGEAQKKIAYSYLKVTECYPNVNYSGLKVTCS